MKAPPSRTAFYDVGSGTGGLRDWVTLLHPPYTLWHLSYVAIGAAVVPHLVLWRLGGTLLAFFLAVGIGAHALDELHGRPLGTGIGGAVLIAAAAASIGAAMAMGVAYGGLRLLPFVIVGALFAFGYNLELAGGILHSDLGFAVTWGRFPCSSAPMPSTGRCRPPPGSRPRRRSRCRSASDRSAPRSGRCAAGSRWPRSGSPGATAASASTAAPNCWPRWSGRCVPSPGP